MSTPRLLRFFGLPPSQGISSKTKPNPPETIRKTMQVALPTIAIIAAAYVFLSHLPLLALAISVTAVSSTLIISYYQIVKPLFYPSDLGSPSSPPKLERPRKGGAASAPLLVGKKTK